MATTSPDNLYSPDSSDPYALTQDLGAMQDSVQTALVRRANAYVGTSAQRNAFTTAPVGAIWSDTNGSRLVYKRGASAWESINEPIPDTGWINLVGWSGGFTEVGGGVQYRKLGNEVRMKGFLLNATTSGSWDSTGVSLPVGFRPLTSSMFPATANSNAVKTIDISSAGLIRIYSSVISSAWIPFAGVSFWID